MIPELQQHCTGDYNQYYYVESANKTVRCKGLSSFLRKASATNAHLREKTVEGPPYGTSKLNARPMGINSDYKQLKTIYLF